jgi:hypothetical protein
VETFQLPAAHRASHCRRFGRRKLLRAVRFANLELTKE